MPAAWERLISVSFYPASPPFFLFHKHTHTRAIFYRLVLFSSVSWVSGAYFFYLLALLRFSSCFLCLLRLLYAWSTSCTLSYVFSQSAFPPRFIMYFDNTSFPPTNITNSLTAAILLFFYSTFSLSSSFITYANFSSSSSGWKVALSLNFLWPREACDLI